MTFKKTQDFKKQKRNQEEKKKKQNTLMLQSIDKIKLVIMGLAYWENIWRHKKYFINTMRSSVT